MSFTKLGRALTELSLQELAGGDKSWRIWRNWINLFSDFVFLPLCLMMMMW